MRRWRKVDPMMARSLGHAARRRCSTANAPASLARMHLGANGSASYTSHMVRHTASLRFAFASLAFAAQGAASRTQAPSRAGLQKTPAHS